VTHQTRLGIQLRQHRIAFKPQAGPGDGAFARQGLIKVLGLITVLLSHEYLDRTDHLGDDDILDYAINRATR
jgi:hypothetical protein